MNFKAFTLALLSFATTGISQVSDGPYVSWVNPGTVSVEAVCDSRWIKREVVVSPATSISDPCSGAPVATLQTQHAVPTAVYSGVSKYFAISDIEGHYPELLQLLSANGIINSKNQWSFGDGHLIIVGDSVDRGEHVTEVLWLLYRLQAEAEAKGGKVHMLLGNHDVFAIEGDDRYLHAKYQESFQILDRDYEDFFAKNTEFGRWFRSRNVMLKIDDTLFTHAGLAKEIVDLNLSLPEVNRYIQAGLADPTLEKTNSKVKWLMGSNGPLWYRGYFKDDALSSSEVSVALKAFGVRRVVVGHTIVDKIVASHGDQVIAIDTSFSKISKISGLLFVEGQYYRAGIDGKTTPLFGNDK